MEFLLIKPVGIIAIFVITAWMLKSYLTHRENMKGLTLMRSQQMDSDQRLARVEQAVEAIAIEVERISEGQRYVTKLLSDKQAIGPGAAQDISSRREPEPARKRDA